MSGIAVIIRSMQFMNPYLKEERRNLPYTRISKKDFIPKKIKEFQEAYKKRIDDNLRPISIRITNENYQKLGPEFSVYTLKKGARDRFDACVSKRVDATYQCRLEAFDKGEPCYKVHLLLPKIPLTDDFFADPLDFDVPLNAYKDTTLSELDRTESNEAINRLRTKRVRNPVINASEQVLAFLEALDSLNEVDAQYLQLKWYVSLSEELNKNISDLSDDDLILLEEKANIFIKEQKEKAAKIAADKLMDDESKIPSKKKGHQKQKKSSFRSKKEEKSDSSSGKSRGHSSPVTQTWQQVAISQLPSQKPLYGVHQRVERWWKIKKLEDIKNFKDFDSNGAVIKRYENMSEKELQDMKMRHNWPGIDTFLSHESLKKTYSYPYSFDHNGETKEGRALFVSTAEKKAGSLQVGIGKDGTIYHSFLDFMDSKLFLPGQMIKNHNDFASPEDLEESKNWDLTTSYSFSLIENNVIQLEIGEKKEERTLFYIYPVK